MAPVEAVKGSEEPKPEIVVKLEELDDKYLELQKQYDKEVAALAQKYTEKQQPFLDKRTEALSKGNDDASGTPGCPGFWLQAIKNCGELKTLIEEHDEPVLKYLKDIAKEDLDKEDQEKGYILKFTFVANPYFEQTELKLEVHYGETNPYNQQCGVKKLVSTEIQWKDGKDVTVEKVAKKVKGGGAKKAKQKGKETIEPRHSFFRMMFRNMSEDDEEIDPDDAKLMQESMGDEVEDADPEELIEMMMGTIDEQGCLFKDSLIPFAVRFYTGEAKFDDDDDDDDEEEEEEDDDDSEDDDDESEDESPKGKKGGKKVAKAVDAAKPKEECKQQ